MSTRTLGSLDARDVGMTVVIRDGATTVEGILAEVYHSQGDTSGRPITQIRLVWQGKDGVESGTNLPRQSGFRYSKDRELRIPDSSNHEVEVRP